MSQQPSGFRPDQLSSGQAGNGGRRAAAASGQDPVPDAPYPPFLLPPTRRSALSSSPHYSTHTGTTTAVENFTPFTPDQQLRHSYHAAVRLPSATNAAAKGPTALEAAANPPASDRRDRSRSAGELAERMVPRAVGGVGSGGSRNFCPSRAQFFPSHADLYACINCRVPEEEAEPKQDPSLSAGRPKKLGPILLELRRLHLVTGASLQQSGQLFSSSTIAISRGNPQLGYSVASTSLSVRPSSVTSWGSGNDQSPPVCATGLTTGALCVHNFQQDEDGDWTSSPSYFTPRHQRLASCVAWRPSNKQHVAIGLVGGAMNMRRGGGGIRAGGGDRDFYCLVWDVEAQPHSAIKGAANGPVSKFAHNAGVASLAWLQEGHILAVGCQLQTVQIYDLRVSGANPSSTSAHAEGVNGIEVDPHRPDVFATFSRVVGEPVKLWDVRRMKSCLGEIKTTGFGQQQDVSNAQEGTTPAFQPSSLFGTGDLGPVVSMVRWSLFNPGTLCVAMGDTIRNYDTMTSGSRPAITHINHVEGTVADMALHQRCKPAMTHSADVTDKVSTDATKSIDTTENKDFRFDVLQSHRMLVVLSDGTVRDTPKFPIAPLAVSKRDGRIVHALGRTVWIGSTSAGPTAMEIRRFRSDEDVSATMMRRARCLHAARYSMDPAANIQVLSREQPVGGGDATSLQTNREQLLRLWSWIGRAESLCLEETVGTEPTESWPAKGLSDAGVWRLLGMNVRDSDDYPQLDTVTYSDSLSCHTYDSPSRRAALTSCGWTGRFTLSEVLTDCESLGEFERSAALAVWHGDIGAAVEALQRGGDSVRSQTNNNGNIDRGGGCSPRYAETLQLVSVCIAGYSGMDPNSSSSAVWRRACTSLLQRDELTGENIELSRVAYLRSVCTFLINVGLDDGLDKVLYDKLLCLCDRVAFACRFLERKALRAFLVNCVEECKKEGNLEGLVVTGLGKNGIGILQSYVDRTADVQTAATVCSRVILPGDWVTERAICSEWLDSYRDLLNTWQMWQSRAMFDVDRAELLRLLKAKQGEDLQAPNVRGGYYQGRGRGQHGAKKLLNLNNSSKQQDIGPLLPSVPAQLDARCNFCNTSLSGLRRKDGVANQWLNKSKPVLSCCPRCRKPLPRCAICLLSLGCLNPYLELKKSRSGAGLQPGDDLTSLANLPFAEWFTWCIRCKHGGHAHHLVGWFANHDVCPVSGCDCCCQFDGVQVLKRPALANPIESKGAVPGW